jgi:beta-glucanase (GH16 family)
MKIRTFLMLMSLLLAVKGVTGQNWQLVWSDEFDGDTLDGTKWSYQTGTGSQYGLDGWGNNELQYYRPENVVVGEGMLTVTAKKEVFEGMGYTSGRIRTFKKGGWTYGRFEFRAKMPEGKGLWAAIWMLSTYQSYGGWAASGEIDIMEYLGDETKKVHGTLHFGREWPNNASTGTTYTTYESSFSEAFHDFALEWEAGEMRWYVDGNLYLTLGEGDWYSQGEAFPAPFDRQFHLLINLAVGGNWPGSPDAATDLPQELVIDYVRVYEDVSTGVGAGSAEVGLEQNRPNPFGDYSTITFSLPAEKHVLLEVYDTLGRRVQTLANKLYGPGSHQVGVEANTLEPGLYSYRLQAGSSSAIRQMVIL